jgi:hypothetical protein
MGLLRKIVRTGRVADRLLFLLARLPAARRPVRCRG